MVMPCTSTSWRAALTASSKCGLIIASIFFIQSSPYRLWHLWRSHNGTDSFQLCQERSLNSCGHFFREFQAVTLGHIEDIERVTPFRRDSGANNFQSQPGENAGNLVSQAGLVNRVNFDHG